MFSGIPLLCSLVLTLGVSTEDADAARQIVHATGVRGGLVVHAGCGDGRLTAALRVDDGYLVHGLDADRWYPLRKWTECWRLAASRT